MAIHTLLLDVTYTPRNSDRDSLLLEQLCEVERLLVDLHCAYSSNVAEIAEQLGTALELVSSARDMAEKEI